MDIFMAFFDMFPVICFLIGAIFLQRDLYNKMSKGAFALFSGGTIFIFIAGFFKGIQKILYYTNICNFEVLAKTFFPMQTTGFVLAAAGILAMIIHPQGEYRYYSFIPLVALAVSPAIWDGTMLFVVLMIIGVIIFQGSLIYISIKNKCIAPIIIFSFSIIFILGMGYLSTKPELSDWIKEIVNLFGQGLFLIGVIILHKHGLGKEEYKVNKENI